MTSFCSDPFDALQVASEVLGLPVAGREPSAELPPDMAGNGRDSKAPVATPPADTGKASSRPCLYLAADKDNE